MGAQSSAQRDGKSQEDASASASASASAGDLSTEVKAHQEGGSVLDSKSLQKNGQISSMTSLNGHSEDNTLSEVGQPDGVSVGQKEEATETMENIQDEVTPQVNGEKVDKESSDANDISAVEEKAAEEKPDDASEVGFKKIFRFVGFKFTLKKDKSEEKDPVKLLTVKDKEGGEEGSGADEPAKEEEEAAAVEEKSTAEEKEADTNASVAEVTTDAEKAEITEATPEDVVAEATDEAVKEEGAEKEGETTSPPQESAMSPFRKFFSGGLFSNLRKKASIKKPKEDGVKEVATEEETAKTEETVTAVEEKEAKDVTEEETKEEVSETAVEEKSEPKEEAVITPQEVKSEDHPEPEVTAETPAVAETTTDETKQEDQKAEATTEEEEKAPTEVTSEAELLSSQEKAKPQGSPLKKLFTGAGLKKLSTKKQKSKKDTETKLTESEEQVAEQLQSSTESAESPKADSGPSSPEESGEHVIAVEVTQNESSQETEGEVGSDGEKKKEGIMAWSSFKKLVTPKKRVKRSSESEDETTGEKPVKSATLSSSESAALADKNVEEAKEYKPSEEEPKTETTEKLLSSTEEPKKKMDTSVSWEALMCMGGPKKRSRKTSDSDDEETKIEEETLAAAEGEKEGKTEATTDTEGEPVSSPEPLPSSPERETTWGTLKRIVMPKNKAKVDEKPEETADQVQSDSEAPKDESAFSLRKFFPGRKKKKADKQSSTDQSSGEEDSETPAVVPLSEYDGQVEAEPEASPEPDPVQTKVSAEDRSPSWIPAGVEDVADKHDQLSDIPEEAENAATPKSVDTDIADDETEDQATLPKPPGRTERRLSTAEVKPVDPAPAAATTPVPQRQSENAEEVMEGIEVQISEIPSQTCVAVEDVPVEVAAEKTEPEPPIENAKATTNVILEPHTCEEAMAICTGLGTKEIAKVALEKPAQPMVETVAVIRDALSSEVSVEEMQPPTVEAVFTEDPVLRAQVQQVESTELELAVENLKTAVVNTHVASLGEEPDMEKVGVVNTVPEESEVLQPTTMSENSPKTVLVSPIVATAETVICTQSVEVSEVTVETKEMEMKMEQFAATEENIPVEEVFQAVAAEMASDTCETTKATLTEETEPSIPVVLPSQEAPVIKDTVVLVAPVNVVSEKVMDQTASESKVANVEQIKEQETTEEIAETTEEVPHVSEIEVQSMAIAQNVIQDAVDKVSEDAPEPKKPYTPSATIPTPVQATATTEKEIDFTAEAPVITDTPVPIVCEKPVTNSPQPLNVAIEVMDAIPIEITENLEEVEKKPEECAKQDAEVKVSEKTAEAEEAGEVKQESQTSKVPEQVKEEQSKDQDAEVKAVPEKVESQSEEVKSEVPSEKKKEKVLEVHIPIQVVLQTAHVVEEPSIEEEAVEEFDSNGPTAEDTSAPPKSSGSEKLPVLPEEPQATNSAEDTASSRVTDEEGSQSETDKTSSKCAEVMAQVIEVIEEAVKEIEPVSTEITAAS